MLHLLIAATDEPVDVEEAKRRLRFDGDALDADIRRMISAGREAVEQHTGYALAEASYSWSPVGTGAELPIQPAIVTSEEGVRPILITTKPGPAPESLRSAVIFMVGEMLRNPELTVEQVAENPVFQQLVFPWRRVLP